MRPTPSHSRPSFSRWRDLSTRRFVAPAPIARWGQRAPPAHTAARHFQGGATCPQGASSLPRRLRVGDNAPHQLTQPPVILKVARLVHKALRRSRADCALGTTRPTSSHSRPSFSRWRDLSTRRFVAPAPIARWGQRAPPAHTAARHSQGGATCPQGASSLPRRLRVGDNAHHQLTQPPVILKVARLVHKALRRSRADCALGTTRTTSSHSRPSFSRWRDLSTRRFVAPAPIARWGQRAPPAHTAARHSQGGATCPQGASSLPRRLRVGDNAHHQLTQPPVIPKVARLVHKALHRSRADCALGTTRTTSSHSRPSFSRWRDLSTRRFIAPLPIARWGQRAPPAHTAARHSQGGATCPQGASSLPCRLRVGDNAHHQNGQSSSLAHSPFATGFR